jgi:hypothetical protein
MAYKNIGKLNGDKGGKDTIQILGVTFNRAGRNHLSLDVRVEAERKIQVLVWIEESSTENVRVVRRSW